MQNRRENEMRLDDYPSKCHGNLRWALATGVYTACTLKLRLVKLLREGGMFAVTGGFPFALIDAFQRTISTNRNHLILLKVQSSPADWQNNNQF